VTVYEVIMRSVFNAPTQWAFEVVMVICATAWMLSACYIPFHKRHIGITFIYLMVSENKRWWLDLVAMVVGVIALFLLASDTLVQTLESIDVVERVGSSFNSPAPMLLKIALTFGSIIYLIHLLVNLKRHFTSPFWQYVVIATALFIVFRHYRSGRRLLRRRRKQRRFAGRCFCRFPDCP